MSEKKEEKLTPEQEYYRALKIVLTGEVNGVKITEYDIRSICFDLICQIESGNPNNCTDIINNFRALRIGLFECLSESYTGYKRYLESYRQMLIQCGFDNEDFDISEED